jgi:type II restriction/modification system DNA methylase subunit YeeA
MPLTPQSFLHKWRNVTLTERASYQQHFLDLCELLDHKKPVEIDPSGHTFCFEKGAIKTTGAQGFADVWYRDHFAWEYKGPHANLDKAYQQLLLYREDLQNPPLLIVSDIQTIQIHTNFTGTIKQIYTLTLDDLADYAKRDLLRAAFFDPYSLRSPLTPDEVTQKAAAHFAELAESLRQSGCSSAETAHFLIRLLFCLFAEDTGLLPPKAFSNLAVNLRAKPARFKEALSQLFSAMATGGLFGSEEILHFDGRLFDDASVLDLTTPAIDILIEVSRLDWANIEPSIFGTLFERSLDPAKRSQLGAHYTAKEDILLIVEPVLMAPLRREWAAIQAQADGLAAQRDAAPAGRKRTDLHEQLTSLLTGFSTRLAAVTVLDAACGSGNFLYIALRQLLDLEKEVVTQAGYLGVGTFIPSVNPAQLHGIEINETAHQLAQAAIQIGYIQWLRDNGFGHPAPPILKPLDTIQHKDAILAYDDTDRPYEPTWPPADVIIGNPPFLGGNKIRNEMGSSYVDALFNLYEGRVPAFADLVCYWFEKARTQIQNNKTKRAGLLTTQSIRGGANRKVLERIKKSGDIFMAWSDRDWILDGATVHVSMVGFDDGSEREKNSQSGLCFKK